MLPRRSNGSSCRLGHRGSFRICSFRSGSSCRRLRLILSVLRRRILPRLILSRLILRSRILSSLIERNLFWSRLRLRSLRKGIVRALAHAALGGACGLACGLACRLR